ncbi:hypothetical protein SAMN02927924_02081 [Sphingobium faniae]|nr:hypothetical protein SAMN02927924_02081 [Sphingobium faniae]
MGLHMTIARWLCVLAALGAPSLAVAQQAMRLDTQMFVERVQTDINGRERRILSSADRMAPGDQLIFVIHWRHTGTNPAKGAAITKAVPPGARINASDPRMEVSVDGGARWGRLDQLWLPTPLGGVRRAVAEDVTHVRWTLSQSALPGESGRLSYRAVAR